MLSNQFLEIRASRRLDNKMRTRDPGMVTWGLDIWDLLLGAGKGAVETLGRMGGITSC